MQPLILSIPGDFWDVQIYRGRLYLWHYDGRLSVYDWEKLVELAYPKDKQSLVVKAAWLHGNSLYNSDVLSVFEDPEFNKLLHTQCTELAADPPVITPHILKESLYGEQDNPVKELPTDTEIFNNILYLVTYEGLWSATAHRYDQRYPVSSRPKKRWDAQIYSASASHGSLALSAGDDGLFEYDLGNYNRGKDNDDNIHCLGNTSDKKNIEQLSRRHSSYADWTFASVYSTSLVAGSYLLAFDWQHDSVDTRRRRVFVREIDESEILRREHKTSLSWGGGDKICGLSGEELSIVQYVQKFVDEQMLVGQHNFVRETVGKVPFNSVGTIRLNTETEVVKAGLTYFGILLETEDQLIVYRSDNKIWSIPGPIVRWRTYPRTRYYENHLHIVVQDAVYIVAFMHDYWQQQKEKVAGIAYRTNKSVEYKPRL